MMMRVIIIAIWQYPQNFYGHMKRFAALLFTLSTLLFQSPAQAEQVYWSGVAGKVNAALDDAEALYRKGDAAAAKKAILHAYFGVFESTKMEAAMRTEIGAKHTFKVERRFGQIRKAIKKGQTADDVKVLTEELKGLLLIDAGKLDKAGITKEVFKVNQ